MNPKIILQITSLLCFILNITSLCTMKQDCDIFSPDCKPSPADLAEPQILLENSICPEFSNKLACCNYNQTLLLQNSFESIDLIFGSNYYGCDICAVNLKRFWCQFACDPDQHSFLKLGNVTDYLIDEQKLSLRTVNMTLNNETNSELFDSCKKTKYVSEVPEISNAVGFTTFMGRNAFMRSPVFINMDYSKDGGMTLEMDACDTKAGEDGKVRGYVVKGKCKCDTCQDACNLKGSAEHSTLEGTRLFEFLLNYTK